MALFRKTARLADMSSAGAVRSLTAATASVPLRAGDGWAGWKWGERDWQLEGWRMYDLIAEHRFIAGWIGDSVSQARLYVARIDPTGEETGEVDDPAIARLAAVPLGSGSQRDDNLRLMGINLAVPGEAWVVAEDAFNADPKRRGKWWVVTGRQIKRDGEQISVPRPITHGGGMLTLTDGVDVLVRVWRPHPADIAQADSPTRAALPILREAELITKRKFAELDSRLTGAGLWFLPEGVGMPAGGGDPEQESLWETMIRTFGTAIQDPESASARVPMIQPIPASLVENMDKWKDPVRFWTELSAELAPWKKDALARLGTSFEIPTELVSGMGDSNHWTAWAISEDGIKRIKPYLAAIADGLTRGFLHHALDDFGVDDPESYTYAFDTAPLAVRPNRLPEALDLNDRGLLTDEETVKAGAFKVEQMPTDDERLKMVLFKALQADPLRALEMLADPGIRAALGISGQVPVITVAEAPKAIDPPPDDEDDDPTPDTLDDGPPDGASPGPGSASAQGLITASRLLVLRALERAGNRLTTPAERRGKWARWPKYELHTRIGPISPDKADALLAEEWEFAEAVAADYDLDPAELRRVLHSYCRELLTLGREHREPLLAAALTEALR